MTKLHHNAKSIEWVKEGDCIRSISHVPSGNGYVKIQRNGRANTIPRIILEKRGKAAPGIDARHTCDNRWCINPAHIIHGTRSDNVQDALIRGRHVPGIGWPKGKLRKAA